MQPGGGLRRSDGGLERGERQPGVDRAADRVADHPARPGVEDDGEIDEAGRDGDIGDVGDPELVRPVRRHVLGKIREDRPVMVAVGGGDKAPAAPAAEGVLAHQPAHLLVIDDQAPMAQLRATRR